MVKYLCSESNVSTEYIYKWMNVRCSGCDNMSVIVTSRQILFITKKYDINNLKEVGKWPYWKIDKKLRENIEKKLGFILFFFLILNTLYKSSLLVKNISYFWQHNKHCRRVSKCNTIITISLHTTWSNHLTWHLG